MSTYGATEMNTPVNLIGADDQVTGRVCIPQASCYLIKSWDQSLFQSAETKQSLNEMSPLTRLFD